MREGLLDVVADRARRADGDMIGQAPTVASGFQALGATPEEIDAAFARGR